MKGLKLSLIILAATLLTIGLGGMAFAFHSGGVAECGGCHSMHAPKTGGSFLLIGTDQSSTCLTCHSQLGDTGPSSYHIATADGDMPAGTAPLQRTPGGDFGWLKKTYTFTVRSTVYTEAGQTHGHNVIAVDNGYGVDTDNPTAPGGTFPASQLACNSCHDPHGKYRRIGGDTVYTIATAGAPIIGSGSYNNSTTPVAGQAVGSYRLLAGSGYSKASFPGVPIASAPSTYNQSEATNQVRVAYGHASAGSGKTSWGEWCATCHTAMHSSGNYVHPVDESLGSTMAGVYNAYVNSGNTVGGNAGTSYLSLVPFMENTSDYAILKSHASNTNGYLNGPGSSDKVACLSCHRAHATGFPEMLRWQMEGEFVTYVADVGGAAVWPGTDTTPSKPQFARGRLAAETQAAYYDRNVSVFGAYQRVLCNKCHAQD